MQRRGRHGLAYIHVFASSSVAEVVLKREVQEQRHGHLKKKLAVSAALR